MSKTEPEWQPRRTIVELWGVPYELEYQVLYTPEMTYYDVADMQRKIRDAVDRRLREIGERDDR